MIMVNDLTINNYTHTAAPVWERTDNYAALLHQDKTASNGLLSKLGSMLRSVR